MPGSNPTQQVTVATKAQFDAAVQQYMMSGYVPRQLTQDLGVLAKSGAEKNLGCMFVIAVLVFFPVAILMYMNAKKNAGQSVVIVRFDPTSGSTIVEPGAEVEMPKTLLMSDDRRYWWNGTVWVDANESTPPMAKRSANDTLWWDDSEWRPVR